MKKYDLSKIMKDAWKNAKEAITMTKEEKN